MTKQFSVELQESWTWADQISTYRFWGLLIFYFLSTICVGILSSFMALFLTRTLGLEFKDVGITLAVMSIASLFGFYIAWGAIHGKTVAVLVIAGVLQLLGALLMTITSLSSITILRLVGASFFGLGVGTITLAIPSIVSGGRGGNKTFVISFGIVFLVTHIGELLAPVLGTFALATNLDKIGIYLSACMILGIIALLPVKSSLFNVPPPQRNYPIMPTYRNPISVAVLCLIPFYWFYWLYKAHGEVASIAPSRNILSPQASWLASMLIPLAYPIIITSLTDALNMRALELGKPSYRSSWVTFLSAFIFLPIALALVQSDLNKAIVEFSPNAA